MRLKLLYSPKVIFRRMYVDVGLSWKRPVRFVVAAIRGRESAGKRHRAFVARSSKDFGMYASSMGVPATAVA